MQTSIFSIKSAASASKVIPFDQYHEKENLLIQIFSGLGGEALQQVAKEITQQLPQAVCIGATTDGEINNASVSTQQCIVSISHFEKSRIQAHCCTHLSSYDTGYELAKKLTTDKTKLLIILSDGSSTNGDELLQGIYAYAPGLMVAGGMAGDNASFKQSHITHNGELIKKGAVAVALDSDQLQVHNHYSFDWQPIGKKLLVTHSEKNRVYTINNKPAAAIYAHYLGSDIAQQMPAIGIEFPLVMKKNGISVARAALAIHDDGSLSFAGNIPQESEVQFGFGNTASIINKSISGASQIANRHVETFFIYSCMARRRYMPDNINIEIAPYANRAPTAGFFTYGEFFHTPNANELMNQTLTAVALSESAQSISTTTESSQDEVKQHVETVQTFNALSNLIKTSTDELNETFELFDNGQFILFKRRNEAGWPVEYVSNNVADILGYSAKDFQLGNIDVASLIHPDDLNNVVRETSRAINNNSCDHYIYEPYRFRKHNGEYLWFYDTTRIIRDENHQITHLVNYLTDITTRKKAEQELHLYASIFHSSSEAIVVTDKQSKIISINPAFTTITGYSESEAVGRTPNFLSSGKHGINFYDSMWKELNETGKWQGEIWNRTKTGELYAEWLSISTILDKEGDVENYIALFSDITETKLISERVEFLAHHDALTALPNRVLFQDRMHQSIVNAGRQNSKVALLYLDIDHFKSVNDSLGHRIGDLLLKQVVTRLQETLRQGDTISRQGGDEFLILIDNMSDVSPVMCVIEKIAKSMKVSFNIDEHQIHTSTSIGIAIYPDDGNDFDTLLQHADTAMYHAKNSGRNTYHFFTSEMHAKARQKHFMQNYLHDAIPNKELCLRFQPQYCLHSKQVIGVEALLRWNSEVLGSVPPEQFIPVSEENGQIIEIGNWVMREACLQLKQLRDLGHSGITMAVNISALQFKQANFITNLLSIIEETGVPAANLELELTESILISNIQRNLDTLTALKEAGFKLAIDDFGTGYSSLSYLKRFPADVLKIDRAFISDIIEDESDKSIVNAIIGLCKNFNLKVIAEGVETAAQFEHLQQQGCDIIQGYFFSKPLSGQKLVEKLGQQHCHPQSTQS